MLSHRRSTRPGYEGEKKKKMQKAAVVLDGARFSLHSKSPGIYQNELLLVIKIASKAHSIRAGGCTVNLLCHVGLVWLGIMYCCDCDTYLLTVSSQDEVSVQM